MSDDLIVSLYRHSFPSFVRFLFGELHPHVELIDNWHIDLICDRLMQCADGDVQRLAINLPPRYLKSLITSIAWPLFLCAHRPGVKVCICAGNYNLSLDLLEQHRRLLATKRLRQIFPNLRMTETPGRLRFANGSEIVHSVVHRSQMGRGADIYIVDDPQSAADAEDDIRRQKLHDWFTKEVVRGLNRKTSAVIVVVMQRLHPKDFCGTLMSESEPWEQLILSAIAKADERWTFSDGTVLIRRAFEPLSPRQEDQDALYSIMRQIEGSAFYAQYLQAPSPHGVFRTNDAKSYAYDGWTIDQPLVSEQVFVNIMADILRDYFGIVPKKFLRPGLRLATKEEFMARVQHHQRKLIAETRSTRSSAV